MTSCQNGRVPDNNPVQPAGRARERSERARPAADREAVRPALVLVPAAPRAAAKMHR
jgi:hypothetical protein